MRTTPATPRPSDTLTLIAGTWLASGCVLLGLTPLPWHDATLGWSPAFWLLAAPCLLLLARAWCARQPARATAPHGQRAYTTRSDVRPMPMASRVRPRARPRTVATPRTAEAGLRLAHSHTRRPAQRVG